MGARGSPEPQNQSQLGQVQPQIEFPSNFDGFWSPFWEAFGSLGTTFWRPGRLMGHFSKLFGIILQPFSFGPPFGTSLDPKVVIKGRSRTCLGVAKV